MDNFGQIAERILHLCASAECSLIYEPIPKLKIASLDIKFAIIT